MNNDLIKRNIVKYLDNQQDIYFHYKGRVSLYAILKAMGVGKGDEVIIPAFTCVVVPNPIIYLGAKPVYVDIDKIT
jgi:perosamine synthetase